MALSTSNAVPIIETGSTPGRGRVWHDGANKGKSQELMQGAASPAMAQDSGSVGNPAVVKAACVYAPRGIQWRACSLA